MKAFDITKIKIDTHEINDIKISNLATSKLLYKIA